MTGQPQQGLYLITEMQVKSMMILMNRNCEMDEDEFIEIGKELRFHPYQSEREKLLDELASKIDKLESSTSTNNMGFNDGMWCAFNNIRHIIAELRAGERE